MRNLYLLAYNVGWVARVVWYAVLYCFGAWPFFDIDAVEYNPNRG